MFLMINYRKEGNHGVDLLVRNWCEQRLSSKGEIYSSVTGNVGRVY